MSILDFLSHGLLDLSVMGTILFTLAITHITIVSVTVYLHRYSAHRSLELHPALKHFFRFWLWLTTAMVTKEWTAIHRKHHVFCETDEDPHSPVVQGIGEIFWRGTEAYRTAGDNRELVERYGKGCPEDWLERNVYSRFIIGGVAVMLIVNVALLGVIGITVWAIQMMWIPVTAAGIINGIGHWVGYRNFECPDAARNIVPWGILIGGEELHNNHHTYPNSAKLSVKWYEFDLGWAWIKLFETLGMAKVISTGPVVERFEGKAILDKDAAWALLNDRFRVMSRYADEVVKPVIEQEYHRADAASQKLIKRARKVLVREDVVVSDTGRDRIMAVIEKSSEIRAVYEAHQKLQAIWAKRGGNMEEVIAELRAWCAEAEASGMQSLHEFADTLKSYGMPARTTV